MFQLQKTTFALAALFGLAAAGCGGGEAAPDEAESATGEMTADADVAPAGGALGLPAGYSLRLDKPDAMAADFRAMPMGDGVHVQTGPAGILYDVSNAVASGDYTLSATFTEIGAPPNHREGLGLVFGGGDLQGADQRYSYFLVRADGKYNIIRRTGETTASVTGGWVESDAVAVASGDADVTNTLEVQVMGESVHFRVNGTEVTTLPAAGLDVHGIAGLRINHNLNVHVSGWSLTAS
jgi:hypothetical protein